MVADNPYRLPRAVTPQRYELQLVPDLAAASFSGSARIAVHVHEPVTTIVLNAAELQISSARLIGPIAPAFDISVSVDEDREEATLSLDRLAEAGGYSLELEFTGVLNDKLRGFYRSTFVNEQGHEQVIATTQFEAADARRAFPCWDEPDFKAVFSVVLIVDDRLTALSNAGVVAETSLGDGTRRVEFADTMIMSTYLVAFIVGEFVISDPVDVDGVPLRVACVPGKQHLTPFAIEAGVAALRYMTSYFGIDYPSDKLDLIAVPDFAFGAMENLGCVTFRETALLIDPARASRVEVERVADVIGHEIAHMWFGDLVTMKWWNGIWLNEAFATFMQISFTNDFRPAWQRWASFGVARSAAMAIDSLSSTRPIEFEVLKPAEAQGMFDLLTYQKGGAVLRMLEQYLGPQDFADGISAYLAKHSYANAETTDLWDALEDTTSQPVRAMMDSWILQGGHPVVRVGLDETGTITLSQRRFRYLPDDSDTDQPTWLVPVGLRGEVAGAPYADTLVLDSEATTRVPGAAPTWLVANDSANGFYRVSYDAAMLAGLIGNLASLNALERFALVTDTWALCLAGQTSLDDVLNVLQALQGETDADVWAAMLSPLRLLDKAVPDDARPRYQAFVAELVAPAFERLGWSPVPGEDERAGTLRGTLLAALGGLAGDAQTQRNAADRYRRYEQDPSSLDPDLVVAVQACLAATNAEAYYDQLRARFGSDTATPQEKVNALGALAKFTDPDLVERTLALILGGEVRSQDAPYIVAQMLTQRGSGPAVWRWCEHHWDELLVRFPDNTITRMVEGVSAQLDPGFADEATEFLTEHPIAQGLKSIQQTCERLQVNANFYAAHRATIAGLFR